MSKIGLVVGKFYPPHRGHRYLIATAARQVDHLIVLVCDNPNQTIGAAQRAAWLREIHPTVDIRIIPDIGYDDNSAVWAKYTQEQLGFAPDIVFSSEDYGPVYAKLMGSEHVMVDRQRTTFPISGTQVRHDPWAAWEFLEPCVRAHYVKRVCALGAESTGTTTIAQDLAKAYRTVWVPEYGREYSIKKFQAGQRDWTSDEFVSIAKEQSRQEDELARQANRILICDTNAFATGIWHERYMEHRSPVVERVGAEHQPDLYLLTDDTIPFVQDGWRDGEHIRHWMHKLFIQRLNEQSVPWILVTGTPGERLRQAQAAINSRWPSSVSWQS